jgi:hypothetical protein
MYTKRITTRQLYYRPVSTSKPPKIANEQIVIKRLKAERKKIRDQLLVGSFVDNWPYITVLPEKLRGKLFHRLRLLDEALSRRNKIRRQTRVKKQRLAK